LECRGSTKNR